VGVGCEECGEGEDASGALGGVGEEGDLRRIGEARCVMWKERVWERQKYFELDKSYLTPV
jgi:hypothetical protein